MKCLNNEKEKIMKKIIILGASLFILVMVFLAACSQGDDAVTLGSLKKTLKNGLLTRF